MKGKGGQCMCLGASWICHFKSVHSLNIATCMLLSKSLQLELEGSMLTSLFSDVILCFIALCWKLDQNLLLFFCGSGLPLNPQKEGHSYRNLGWSPLSKSTAYPPRKQSALEITNAGLQYCSCALLLLECWLTTNSVHCTFRKVSSLILPHANKSKCSPFKLLLH